MPTDYRIIIQGHLAHHWSTWFDGLTIVNGADGEATLVGPLADQAALHGVLVKLRDLGLPLIALHPVSAVQRDGSSSNDQPGADDPKGTANRLS